MLCGFIHQSRSWNYSVWGMILTLISSLMFTLFLDLFDVIIFDLLFFKFLMIRYNFKRKILNLLSPRKVILVEIFFKVCNRFIYSHSACIMWFVKVSWQRLILILYISSVRVYIQISLWQLIAIFIWTCLLIYIHLMLHLRLHLWSTTSIWLASIKILLIESWRLWGSFMLPTQNSFLEIFIILNKL